MKIRNVLLLLVVFTVVSSIITAAVIDRGRILRIEKYPMDVEVKKDGIIGINVDSDGFHFGSLKGGTGVTRQLKILQVEQDALVTIIMKGEIVDWVNAPSRFIIRPGEEKEIDFKISVPDDAELGYYSGEATVILRKLPENE